MSSRSWRGFVRLAVPLGLLGLLWYFAFDYDPGLPADPLSSSEAPTHLWSYVPGLSSDPEENHNAIDGWEWVSQQRRRSAVLDKDVVNTRRRAMLKDREGARQKQKQHQQQQQHPLSHRPKNDMMGDGVLPRRPSWGALAEQGAKKSVRTNLRKDKKYFLSFPFAGFNNQVMDIFASVHLAFVSNRIPILAPILPDTGHMGGNSPPVAVGEIFDLNYLSLIYERPVVELHELKVEPRSAPRLKQQVYDGEVPGTGAANGAGSGGQGWEVGDIIPAEVPEYEDIGCWSSGLAWHNSAGWWGGMNPAGLHLTPYPRHVFHPGWERQSVYDIAQVLNNMNPSKFSNHSVPGDSLARLEELGQEIPDVLPDDHLACSDSTFYVLRDPIRNDMGAEWRDGLGTWHAIGQYMRFQPGLIRMAEDVLREMWGLKWNEEIPVYMAVHIRHGDFASSWKDMTQRQWSHRAWEVIKEAKVHLGIEIKHIVVTTDETDENWIKAFKDIGWHFIDHRQYRTGERLGWWFPTILDAIILSQSKVFLGMPSSTMSILPYRRVIEWNHGLGRFIQLGHPVPEDWQWKLDW